MFSLFSAATLLIFCTSRVTAGTIGGYHYEKPSAALSLVEAPSNIGHGHNFAPLPTVQPLPPVPNLPPLPTPRTKGQFVQTQTIYQAHPVAAFNILPGSYDSTAGTNVGKIAQQYQSPLVAQHSLTSSVKTEPVGTGLGQPLRVPFGKEAIISFPTANEDLYEANGRQLKQYAVIEIIDNDIEQDTHPFSYSPFFENYRAPGGIQFGSRSNAKLLGRQRIPAQVPNHDAVALGSGGLGFIRLPNGNVYLGSGSLGYISGQQHTQDIQEARTRSGAPQPDALHFGHGPLGQENKFSLRFN